MTALADTGPLQAQSVFAPLTPEVFEGLLAAARPVRGRRGEVLFSEGDPCDILWLVQRGWIRLYRITRDGEERVLGYRTCGHLVGESALLGRAVHNVAAQMHSEASLVALARHDVSDLLDRSPILLRQFLKVLAVDLARSQQDLVDATGLDVPSRVLRALVTLGQRHGEVAADGTCRILVPMSQQELAYLVGTTRETVSRLCVTLPGVHFEQRSLSIERWTDFEALHA